MKKDAQSMTKSELLDCRHAGWSEEVVCRSIVIIPGSGQEKKLHESGFRCMTFVAIRGGQPVCKLGGGSDVIHIGGIGGFGYQVQLDDPFPTLVPPISWSVDCLPKSGCLQLFLPGGRLMRVGPSLSSFEVFYEREQDKKPKTSAMAETKST